MQCEHHNPLNVCKEKARLRECVLTQLGDAILDLLEKCSAHKQMVEPLRKVKLVSQFRVNKVSGQTFKPVENSSSAV